MLNKEIKKLIFVDLDGTLLNSKRRVSFKTAHTLRKLNSNGYMVVLASGRPWRSLKDTYKKCGCYGPVISYNGSYIFHPKNNDFKTFLKAFKLDDIQTIYSRVKSFCTSFMCENLDTVFINKKDNYLKKYFWYKGMKMKQGEINKILNDSPITCIILRPSAEDTLVDKACEGFGKMKLRHWTNSTYAELYIEDVDKGSALKYVAEQLNINKDDIYAFGDAGNDYTMLSQAGHPFAMSNSKSELLLKSFPHTKNDNNHDGVAETLLNCFKFND